MFTLYELKKSNIDYKSKVTVFVRWFPWNVLQYACCMICHVFMTKFVVTLLLLWCHVTMCCIVLTTWVCHVLTSFMCYMSRGDFKHTASTSILLGLTWNVFFFVITNQHSDEYNFIFDCLYWIISICTCEIKLAWFIASSGKCTRI